MLQFQTVGWNAASPIPSDHAAATAAFHIRGETMLVMESRTGVPIRFTNERWQHIASRHPEIASERDAVLEGVGDPEWSQPRFLHSHRRDRVDSRAGGV